jgi:hypothetical protein
MIRSVNRDTIRCKITESEDILDTFDSENVLIKIDVVIFERTLLIDESIRISSPWIEHL